MTMPLSAFCFCKAPDCECHAHVEAYGDQCAPCTAGRHEIAQVHRLRQTATSEASLVGADRSRGRR